MDFYHRPHRFLLTNPLDLQPGGKAHHGYSNEVNFDTKMMIILAALLCALLCILGLNSILWYALRCIRRPTFESAEQAAAGGLKKSRLSRIPVVVFGSSGVNIPGTCTDCPICLGEFIDGKKVRVLPKCHHGFCVSCIDLWLSSHSSCPICRQSLIDQSTPSDSDDHEAAISSSSGGHADISGYS